MNYGKTSMSNGHQGARPARRKVRPGTLLSLLPVVCAGGCSAQQAAPQPAAQPRLAQAAAPAAGTARPLRQAAGHKKLIAFPRPEPDTAFMRKHITQMEKTPFDGTIFSVKYTKADGTEGKFTWESWGQVAFTEAQLKPALDDLKTTKFNRFKSNFLRFNTASKNQDWFDDFSAIINNARLAASIARQANEATGAVPGIKFDTEQYNDKLFTYSAQRDKATKSWDVYAAQARKRGREVMEAFQAGYPDLTVFR